MNSPAPVYFQPPMPRFAANLSMMFTEVPFPDLMDEMGYAGWVGCEYRPAGRTEDGLGWLNTWRQGRHSE